MKLNNTEIKMITNFYDLTLDVAVDIVKVEIEESKLYNLLTNEEELEFDEDTNKYIVKILTILSNLTQEDLEAEEPVMLTILFAHVRRIIQYIYMYQVEHHQSFNITEYEHNGIMYHMPEHLKVDEVDVYCWKEPSKNFVEASNLASLMKDMEKQGMKHLNILAAIFLREDKDEIYDDGKVMARAEKFKTLPLFVCYEVFFCCIKSMNQYMLLSHHYLGRVEKLKRKLNNLIHGFSKWLKVEWLVMLLKLKKCLFGSYAKY